MKHYGPLNPICDAVHAEKHRARGESFREAMTRIASKLADNNEHFESSRDALLNMRFLPGGRIQSAIGSSKFVTAYNCFVSGTIEDSFVHGHGAIMERAKEAAITMRMGGGIGYDFSTLRPRGALIRKLESTSSGPVSFMGIFNEVCLTTNSAGARRGAQMGVLRVDHPDIEEFVRAKQNGHRLTGFNLSVAVTDEFMQAVQTESDYTLKWGGQAYRTVDALTIWEMIMRSTWDWDEPGVLYIDRINEMNNLYYCETIAATNPCGEQPLPPYGACLLGSFNLTSYLFRDSPFGKYAFDFQQFFKDIPVIVRMMDNVVDEAKYPLHEQENEAKSKRRMGLGVTGMANTIEAMGFEYGSDRYILEQANIFKALRDSAYTASSDLALEKGSFPLYDRDKYCAGKFFETLPNELRDTIFEQGIRNSHLLSIAPTGTISFVSDNVSSGIEPVFEYNINRAMIDNNGAREVELQDYGFATLGVRGKRSSECSVNDHLAVLINASKYVDSAVSKTCNLPTNIPWDDFKAVYMTAWQEGCKGCTTYRVGSKRGAVLKAVVEEQDPIPVTALTAETPLLEASCSVNPVTGKRNCE